MPTNPIDLALEIVMTAGPADLPALLSAVGRRARGADPAAAFRAGPNGLDTIDAIRSPRGADAGRGSRVSEPVAGPADLAMGAADVLRSNDIGSMVTAAPAL